MVVAEGGAVVAEGAAVVAGLAIAQYALNTPRAPVISAVAVVPHSSATLLWIEEEAAAELLSLKQAQLISAVGGAGHSATVRLCMTDTTPDEAHCPTVDMGEMFSIYSVTLDIGIPANVASEPPVQYTEKTVRALLTSSVAVVPQVWETPLAMLDVTVAESSAQAQVAKSVRDDRHWLLVSCCTIDASAEEAL